MTALESQTLLSLALFNRGTHRIPNGEQVVCGATGVVRFGQGPGRGGYLFYACLSHVTIDHASLSRLSTVPTPNRGTSNIWALIMLFPIIT